ncbi:hypothetical protein DdX_00408 [Ditylenchus destructor]|uniref:Uncharacterized protein n=1 Tax=Ditylenchus destructor TaxID=166010 RepID=A0AAD4NF56_9BILA|nr:hypothetical protein DdX_00408 [Ditylenchus destructor]
MPSSSSNRQDASQYQVKQEDEGPMGEKFHFDPNDDFYLAPPMCQLMHYRHAAVVVGILEVLLLSAGTFAFMNLYKNASLTSIWSTICIAIVLGIACMTTSVMIYGIAVEKPQLLIPQITFLHVEIVLLLLGAAGSIASMSLGIEWTYSIFAPFVSIPKMEQSMGPIWPFNVAIVSFSGAALGIWFHVIVQGCYDYLLDKKYFEAEELNSPTQIIQMGMKMCAQNDEGFVQERRQA